MARNILPVVTVNVRRIVAGLVIHVLGCYEGALEDSRRMDEESRMQEATGEHQISDYVR